MNLRIRGKLMLLYLVLVAAVIAGGGVFVVINLERILITQIEEDLRQKARFAAQEYLKFDDHDSLANQLGRTWNLRVTFIDRNGTVLGDSKLDGKALASLENHANRPEIIDANSKGYGSSRRYSTTLSMDLMYVAVRISSGNDVIGVSRVSMSLARVSESIAPVTLWLTVSGIISLILATVLAYFISGIAANPIMRLTESAKRLASGDLTVRTRVLSRDEVGELGRAFNDLAGALENKIVELRHERDLLSAVINGMSEGVLVTYADDRVMISNTAAGRIFSLDSDITDRPVAEVLRYPEIHAAIAEAKKSSAVIEREIDLTGLNRRTLMIHAVQLHLRDEPSRIVIVFHDITNLRRLERVRRDFVANVSHELRTPVATIRGYAETLLNVSREKSETPMEFIEIIEHHSHRLSSLIEDLLELSGIESEEFSLNPEDLSLKEVVADAVSSVRHTADLKQLDITMSIDPDTVDIRADEKALYRILLNLLDNAVKYTPDSGKIRVSSSVEDGSLKITVEDSGIGIDPKHFPRIFERFYRVDKGRSRDLGGTGLGLAIVKHLAGAMDGEISVESRPGKGSSFTVRLPAGVRTPSA